MLLTKLHLSRQISRWLGVWVSLWISAVWFSQTQAAELRVLIHKAVPESQIRGQIFTNPTDFQDRSNPIASFVVHPTQETVAVTVSLPQAGACAIAVFQDLDGSQRLETSFLGLPKEPYGFSNDAEGFMGPPTFEQAAFACTDQNQIQHIHLRSDHIRASPQ